MVILKVMLRIIHKKKKKVMLRSMRVGVCVSLLFIILSSGQSRLNSL
jgi:hypothetical protein